MNASDTLARWRTWLWWVTPLAAFALLLGWETDWGRNPLRPPPPQPALAPTPVAANVLPGYVIEGGLPAHAETVERTLFNPTRRPAPPGPSDGTKSRMQKGQFLLTGTALAGDKRIAFLKEVAGGKGRAVRQGDELNGVLVADVQPDRVKFTLGDDSEELLLKVAAGPKTTSVAPTKGGTPAARATGGGARAQSQTSPTSRPPGQQQPSLADRRRARQEQQAGGQSGQNSSDSSGGASANQRRMQQMRSRSGQ